MVNIVNPFGYTDVSIPANGSIAVYSVGTATVAQVVTSVNHPTSYSAVGSVTNGEAVYGPYTSATTLRVSANYAPVEYEVGAAPQVKGLLASQLQGAPVAVDVTGAVSAAAIIGGIVTSTTAAAVAGTIPTGTVMDAASSFGVGDSVDWSVINTGAANAFTVTAATGHTIVGAAAVAASTSGLFRTRKTAANTFITYRLS